MKRFKFKINTDWALNIGIIAFTASLVVGVLALANLKSSDTTASGESLRTNLATPLIRQADLRNSVSTKEPEVKDMIILSESNSVVMDAVFEDNSVQRVMLEIKALSDRLPKSAAIYLVMNSPGGSVDSGLRLISFIHALPQKVKTLSLFSASMAFHTVQALDERLVIESGTLMSHPASYGVQGQTPYQVAARNKYILAMITNLDIKAAKRMGMELRPYQDMIHDEYWVAGAEAVADNAADKVVLARCGDYKSPTMIREVNTFFGVFKLEIASCPLIPGIIRVIPPSDVKKNVLDYVTLMLTDRTNFTKLFIIDNSYSEYQK